MWVAVGTGVKVAVGTGVCVGVGVRVGVRVGVGVGVGVLVLVGVGVLVGGFAAAMDWELDVSAVLPVLPEFVVLSVCFFSTVLLVFARCVGVGVLFSRRIRGMLVGVELGSCTLPPVDVWVLSTLWSRASAKIRVIRVAL